MYAFEHLLRAAVPKRLMQFSWMKIMAIHSEKLIAREGPSVLCREATRQDMYLLKQFREDMQFDQRFEDGNGGYIATDDRGIVGYLWVSARQFVDQDHHVVVAIQADERWLYDARVRSDSRGRGIYPSLLTFAIMSLRRIGVQKILFSVDVLNWNAVQAHTKVGAIELTTVAVLRIWRTIFVKEKGVAVRSGTLSGKAVPLRGSW